MFNVQNGTSGVFGRKLRLIHVENIIFYVCDFEEEIYSTYVAESIQSNWITCEYTEG